MVMKDVATVVSWVKEASSQVITALPSSGLYLLHRVLQGIEPPIYGAIHSIELLIHRIELLSNALVYIFYFHMWLYRVITAYCSELC